MAYIQKNLPPPNRVLNFTLSNFVGGLNNRSSQLQHNEASDVLNMKFDDEAVMSKRNGIEYFDEIAITGSVTFIDEYKPYQDTFQLIRASNTEVFSGSTKIADVAGKINAVNYFGSYYFVDGDKIRVYGKFPQVGDTHTGIVGTTVGTYLVMELADPPAGYTALGTSEVQGKWVYDYTNSKCWYEPCQNEIDDTYKGGNTLPVKPKFIEISGDRLFIASDSSDDDNVFICDISNGFYFPVFLPLQLPPNGDKIVGIKSFHDSIVVGRKSDIYVIYGNTNRPEIPDLIFRVKKVTTHTGFASNDSMDIVNNYLFYLGHDGNVYAMHTTKTDVDMLATQILNLHVDLFKKPISASVNDLSSASSVFFKDQWYLSLAGNVLVYSYRHKAFSFYSYASVSPTAFYVQDYTLLYGLNTGRLVKDKDAYDDLGKPYRAFWASDTMDNEEPTTFKQYRDFYTVAHVYDTYNSRVNIKFEIDQIDIYESFDLYNMTSVWGKSKFGDRFINRNIVASLPIVIGRRGRTMKFIISNSYFITADVDDYTDVQTYSGKKEGILLHTTSDNKYFLYTDYKWVEQLESDLFQPMRVYEVSGQYELRGKR